MTTANGYMRLLLLGTEMTEMQMVELLQIVCYVVTVYVPMFMKIHLNSCFPEGPSQMIYLRDLLLKLREKDREFVEHSLKKCLCKTFVHG